MRTNETFIKKSNMVVMFKQVGELREAIVLENHGCTYSENTIRFGSKEEGNQFYKMYIDAGFTKAKEEDFDKIIMGF